MLHRNFSLESIAFVNKDIFKLNNADFVVKLPEKCDEFESKELIGGLEYLDLQLLFFYASNLHFQNLERIRFGEPMTQKYTYKYSKASDVYSLGIILFELITGHKLSLYSDLDKEYLFVVDVIVKAYY